MDINTVISTAQASLGNRSRYALDVVDGGQLWSGADLKGKARKYGASYARQRARASQALYEAGGEVIAIEHGLLVTAVQTGMDCYGNAIYQTTQGVRVQRTAARALRAGE